MMEGMGRWGVGRGWWRVSLVVSYMVVVLLYAAGGVLLYVADVVWGENLLPFELDSVDVGAFWYYVGAFVPVCAGVVVRLRVLDGLRRAGGLAPLWFLVLWDVLPGVLAVGLWLVEGVVPVGLLLVGLSGVMVCVDVVAVLRNEFAQVGVLVLALLVFAGCNMGFAQWNRVRVGYDKAGLLVERCECEEGWFLPSADWSVGLYVDGVLVRSEGRHRFLPRMDELAGGGGGVYRLNRMETEYFVFERGEGTFVVSRSGWTDVVTSFTNVTMLFFIYVAMVLGGYWVWFVARRRVLVRRSFFARLRISLLFFLLAGLLVVFLLTVGFVGYRYARNAKSGLEGVMMVLVDHVTPMLGGGGDVGGVLDVVERVSELYNTEVSIYDGLGHLVFTSDTLHVVHNITAWRNNPFEGMESAVETKVEFGYGRKMRVQSYGLIMTGAGETYYAVMWSESDMARMRSELSFFLVMLLVLYFVLVMLAVMFSYIVSRQLAKPLREIDRRLGAITLGAMNSKIDYEPGDDDELSLLIGNYNQMVDKLEESAAELALAERENSWRDMSRQIAHEIKNPLTPMRLILQQMVMMCSGDAEVLRERVRSQAETLLVQVDTLYATACSLSDFARQPMPCPVKVCMSEKVRHVADLFRHNDSDVVVDVVVEPGAEGACVYMDKNLALRLFTNLVRNAIQSIPDTRQGVVRIAIGCAAGEVWVSVSDNGVGMSEEVMGQIFNANFTTKTKGMGLGLCVVKNAVDASGGRIVVDSEVGVGSKFTIWWKECGRG